MSFNFKDNSETDLKEALSMGVWVCVCVCSHVCVHFACASLSYQILAKTFPFLVIKKSGDIPPNY